MTKVVISKVRCPKPVGKRLATARVHSASGKLIDIFTVDAQSPTFESDLTQLFMRNVAAARRENKRLFGSDEGSIVPRVRRAKTRINGVRKD